MASKLIEVVADPKVILALEPAELGGLALQFLNSLETSDRNSLLNPGPFCTQAYEYPESYQKPIEQALMEAWVWLESEGLVARKPGDLVGGWSFITRRGRRIISEDDFNSYRTSSLLPRDLLHPLIVQKTWSLFIRGEYDTAIFQAYKEIEVAVRNKGGFEDTDIGVSLMRKAFHKDTGPLTDHSLQNDAEKDSMAHLFAGAIGLYKNPHSHRNINIDNPRTAVALIILASHLLQIVDPIE